MLGVYNWAILPPAVQGEKESSYHIFALRIKGITEEQRDRIIEEITKREVAVNVHFIPMPLLSFFKNLGYKMEDYPNAYTLFSQEISLPIYPQLTDDQVSYVAHTVVEAYNCTCGS